MAEGMGRSSCGALLLLVLLADAVAVASVAPSNVYPGSNGKIAYVRNDVPSSEVGKPCGGDEVWTINADGSGARAVDSATDAYAVGDPTWSPDGGRIAYLYVTKADHSDRGNPDYLYVAVYDVETDRHVGPVATVPLLDHPAYDAASFCTDPYGPTWSRDGRKLVVQSYYGTHVINLAQDNEVTVMDPTKTPYLSRPSWSPVASELVFESGNTVKTMPASGGPVSEVEWTDAPSGYNEYCPRPGEPQTSTCDLDYLGRPEWSPDGSTIMVATGSSGFSNTGRIGFLDACKAGSLVVVDPNPRNVRTHWYEPSWSPDGAKVVFSDSGYVSDPGSVGGQREVQDLWVMEREGAVATPLTDTGGDVFESAPDWQPVDPAPTTADGCQDALPIVFVPGLLGSDMVCGRRELWPALPNPRFDLMALAPNGVDNGEYGKDNPCSSVVRPSGQIVDQGYGYKDTIKFLNALPRKVAYYGYDWRKSPLLAVPGLDEKVDEIRERAGTDKVVLMAHSMGGLVARAYAETHPTKVERVVTMGTPYLGAPKTWLALAHGRTAPERNALDDLAISPRQLRFFSRTSTGPFFLYPSERYHSLVGRWLSVPQLGGGELLDAQQVLEAVKLYQANETLLQQGYESHAALLEIYPESGVDWQMVTGSGVKTLMTIRERASGKPLYGYGNGDGTVPYQSAAMGDADPSAVHYVCFIAHGKLPGHPTVTSLIKGFLLKGDPIGGRTTPCPLKS